MVGASGSLQVKDARKRDVRPNGSGNSVTNNTTDFRDEQDQRGNDCDVSVGDGSLRSDSGGQTGDASTEALDDLIDDQFGCAAASASGMHHHADAGQADGETEDEEPLVAVREAHDHAGHDGEHGESDGLGVCEVGELADGPM